MSEGQQCDFARIGLIVTGRGEAEHLPLLFRCLMASGVCTVEVLRRIGQRSPITAPRRMLAMVGSGKLIPDRDEEEIGLPARRYLFSDECRFVVLIDDLEMGRCDFVEQIFRRYRSALDHLLSEGLRRRASVHFLANMVEAYFFADHAATSSALGIHVNAPDGDVEDIRHPKNELRALFPPYNELIHFEMILQRLDMARVLGDPATCAWLRALFAWCVRALECVGWFDRGQLDLDLRLLDGAHRVLTGRQLVALGVEPEEA